MSNDQIKRWLQFNNTGIYKENIQNFIFSYHENAYKTAFKKLEDIIKKNFSQKDYNNPLNVLTFIGGRGSGKTSVMMSFVEALKKYDRYNSMPFDFLKNEEDVAFTCLDYIDGSLLEKGEDIFNIVLAQIYEKYEAMESTLEYQNESSNFFKREGLKSLENVYKTVCEIEMMNSDSRDFNASSSYLSALASLSSSQRVRKEFQKMIKAFLEMIAMRKRNSAGYFTRQYLVIPIDDIDLNVENGFAMLEKINRYLMVENVIVVLAMDYQQIQKLAIQHFYKIYPSVDSVLSTGLSYAAKIAFEYLDKLLPLNYRIYMSNISDPYIGEQTGLRDEGVVLKQSLFVNLYERSGICFDGKERKKHFYQPDSIRQVNNFYIMLEKMSSVDRRSLYMSRELSAEVSNAVEDNINLLLQDFLDRMAVDKLYQLTDAAEFLKMLSTMDIRRGKNQVIHFYNEKACEHPFEQEDDSEDFSYGRLIETIYNLGRCRNNQYKPLVHCLLAYFSYTLTREYILERTKERKGSNDDKNKLPNDDGNKFQEFIGENIVEEWAGDLLPAVIITEDAMRDIVNPHSDVLHSEDVFSPGYIEDAQLLLLFRTDLAPFSYDDPEPVIRYICDMEVLYCLITNIKNPYFAHGQLMEKICFKVEVSKSNRYQLDMVLGEKKKDGKEKDEEREKKEKAYKMLSSQSTGCFNILNFIPNTFECIERLQYFETILVDALAKYLASKKAAEMAEAAKKAVENKSASETDEDVHVDENLRKEYEKNIRAAIQEALKDDSLLAKCKAWKEKYGNSALPFPVQWVDLAYNVLKRTRRYAKKDFPSYIKKDNLSAVYDYIPKVYEYIGERLEEQREFYNYKEADGYDFSEQFKTFPAVSYFLETDLNMLDEDAKKTVRGQRRSFWESFFNRVKRVGKEK